MVRPIARRMRLNVDDGALVEFLVRYHLLMTNTAFRRDLEDRQDDLRFRAHRRHGKKSQDALSFDLR